MTPKTSKNPRGQSRPQDGRGQGRGIPQGSRSGRNIGPCTVGGPGRGQGQGRGLGRGRMTTPKK